MARVPEENIREGGDATNASLEYSMDNANHAGVVGALVAQARTRRASIMRKLRMGFWIVLLLVASLGGGVWLGLHLAGGEPQVATVPGIGEHSPVARRAPAESVADGTEPMARQAEFARQLRELEALLASGLAAAAQLPELAVLLEQAVLRKTKAREAFVAGDHDAAQRLLEEAERGIQNTRRAVESRYQLALEAAADAYSAGDAEGAASYVTQALDLKPGAAEAEHWQARIAQLPMLTAARREAAKMRAAGRPREEQAALVRVIELDPDDAHAQQRVAELVRQVREQGFSDAITATRRAIDEQRLQVAQQALARVERLEPQHTDTLALKKQVAALARAQTRDRHLVVAERAVGADDWKGALHAFKQARALDPRYNSAVQGEDLAARIMAAQNGVDDFLARPDRLGTPAIAASARELLSRDAELVALSPRLKEARQALARAIEAGQTPVPVRILSDNSTEIGIRGIGMVGRTREQLIELLPGTYLFEGKRKGYRSKLIEVAVRAGVPTEVQVVCDERS